MTPEPNIEKALAELARLIGSDESLSTKVMSRIDARPISRARLRIDSLSGPLNMEGNKVNTSMRIFDLE